MSVISKTRSACWTALTALALCGASDPASQQRIDALLAEHGAADFAARFLIDVGLDWAAPLLADFPA